MPKKYLCLANSLIEQITEGVYPKGCLLPSEREICEKYNISRTTARQALNILAQEGYITSIQGKGTVVTHPQIQQELGTIYSFDEDMRQLGKNPETHIMDFIEMSAPDALAAIFLCLQAVLSTELCVYGSPTKSRCYWKPISCRARVSRILTIKCWKINHFTEF